MAGPLDSQVPGQTGFLAELHISLIVRVMLLGKGGSKESAPPSAILFYLVLRKPCLLVSCRSEYQVCHRIFHVFLALAAAYALRPAFERLSRKGMAAAQNVIVILLIVTSVFVMFYGTSLSHGNSKRFWRIGKLSTPPLSSKVLDDSVSPPIQIYFPVKGDHCSDAPLPCIPFASALMSREWLCVPGDLGSGFCAE